LVHGIGIWRRAKLTSKIEKVKYILPSLFLKSKRMNLRKKEEE